MTGVELDQHRAFEAATTVTPEVRWEVYDRDQYQCRVCGTSGENKLQLHHWEHWRSHGTDHSAANLVLVCYQCHEDIHARRIDLILLLVYDKLEAFVRRPYRPHRRFTA